MREFLNKAWYPDTQSTTGMKLWYLLPLMYVYQFLFSVKKKLYQTGLLPSHGALVPVIVVGNITVGGTGKTPLVIELVNYLKEMGFQPGVVSRGYGGKAEGYPQLVNGSSSTAEIGDEPMLIFKKSGVPVVIDPNRSRAVSLLAADGACDVVISDDGLQHLAMHRDFEIVVIDGDRLLGNGYLLPVGPLRESEQRLYSVDMLICNQGQNNPANFFEARGLPPVYSMHFQTKSLEPLPNTSLKETPTLGRRIHAVAGIGNPARFFAVLESLGFEIIPHAFDDHHEFTENDLRFNDDLAIIMTEKDAIKCNKLLNPGLWYLPVEVDLPPAFYEQINKFLNIRKDGKLHAR